MSATVLGLVGVLFFHGSTSKPAQAPAAASGQATYTPQAAPDISKGVASVPSPAAAASTASSPASQAPAPANAAIAHLSLATPGNTSAPGALDNALGGRTFSGAINVDGYKVPLPAGSWIILASAHYKSPQGIGQLVFLGQVRNMRLVGAARVTALHTVNPPSDAFPPKLSGCYGQNPDSLYVEPDSMGPGKHQSCWLISSFFTPPLQQWANPAMKIDKLDRAVGGDLAGKGIHTPQDFVKIRMTRTETWGVLEVSYLFSPETAGIKSNHANSIADTDWTRPHIGHYPEKLAYIEKMKQWAMQFWPGFKAGFDAGVPH
jgi:hypothetical protein